MKKIAILLFFFLFLFTFKVWADYPSYTGYINDFAHVLSSETRQNLEKRLSDYDKQTSNQLTIVTVDSTTPETIEQYGIHLADKWKVGQKGKDNGVIMLFAMKDRKMRIEVGRGLEGDLTDLQSKHILDDIIRPQFQSGYYDSGITQGVDAVIATLSHTITPVPPSSFNDIGSFAIIFIAFIVIFIIVGLAYSPHTQLGGRGVWGVPIIWGDFKKDSDDSGGFGGFGGGGFSGGGSSSSW